MKKFLMASVVLLCFTFTGFAALQYEIVSTTDPAQPWKSANQLTLKITEGGSLWLSSFVSNWNVLTDLGTYAEMTAGNYGAVTADGTAVTGTGESKEVTFTSANGKKSVSTNAYLVGNFNAGDEISFWITNTAGVVGDSVEPVSNDYGLLQSRQDNNVDQAGNTRINFGYSGTGSVEFIAYGDEFTGPSPSGKPLPGALATLLLGGAFGGWAMRRRRKG